MSSSGAKDDNDVTMTIAAHSLPIPEKRANGFRQKRLNENLSDDSKVNEDVDLDSQPVVSGEEDLRTMSNISESVHVGDTSSLSQIPNVVKNDLDIPNNNGKIANAENPVNGIKRTPMDKNKYSTMTSLPNANGGIDTKSTKSLPTQEQTFDKSHETRSLKSFIRSKMKQIQSQKISSNSLTSVPTYVRKESLSVPTAGVSDAQLTNDALGSRRESSSSSRLSPLTTPRSPGTRRHYTSVQMTPEDKKLSVISPEDSWIQVAIPYLPFWVAVICLVLNIVFPGTGTVLSGFSILCCGKSRVPPKYDQDILLLLCVNTWVGVAQLFTVTFLLVGWFWSLAWGIKILLLAIEYKRELADERTKELQKMAINAFGNAMYNRSRF